MLNYETLPNPSMEYGLRLYIEEGIMPGSFLTALLSNDFVGAVGSADSTNQKCLREWAMWLCNEMPGRDSGVWGSYENMVKYCEKVRENKK